MLNNSTLRIIINDNVPYQKKGIDSYFKIIASPTIDIPNPNNNNPLTEKANHLIFILISSDIELAQANN